MVDTPSPSLANALLPAHNTEVSRSTALGWGGEGMEGGRWWARPSSTNHTASRNCAGTTSAGANCGEPTSASQHTLQPCLTLVGEWPWCHPFLTLPGALVLALADLRCS